MLLVILEGRLVSGRSVRVESPGVCFVLLFPVWVWAGIAIIGLTGIVFLLFLFRPKLQGRLNFAEPVGRKPVILTKNKKAKKSLKGDSLRFGKAGQELADLHQGAFTITAARGKRLRIKVDKGLLSLIRDGQTKPIVASDLYRSDVLKFDDNGIEYVIEIICPGRRPKKKR